MSMAPEDNSFCPEPIYGPQNTYCAPWELAVSSFALIYIHSAAMRLIRAGTSSLCALGIGAQVRCLNERPNKQNRQLSYRTTNK